LSAGNDLSILSGESRTQMDEHTKASGTSGIASKTTRETHTTIDARTAVGSSLSGDSVQMLAGHDLLVKGSDVVGTQDVRLAAGNNLTVTTAAEQRDESRMIKETKSGLSGTGGIGVSYGSQQSKSETNLTQKTHQGSTLTAGNNLNVIASSGDINVQGSQLQAGNDVLKLLGI
jgi:filamentous hemagglutinin